MDKCEKISGRRAVRCYRAAVWRVAGLVIKKDGLVKMPAKFHWNGCKKHTNMARNSGARIVSRLQQEPEPPRSWEGE